MRKIVSKEDAEKKRKRNNTIIGIILIIVMFGSVFGIIVNSFGNQDTTISKIKYGKYEFVSQNNFWILNLNGANFVFRYNPAQVPKISSLLNPVENYSGKPLYISSNNSEATSEITVNLGGIVQRIQYACPENSNQPCDESLPIKNCAENFIIVQKSEITNLIQNENCVYINAPEENLTQVTDEFLFKIFGVESQ